MKELDYIYEVYRERSFSAAAKKLFVSQPALSVAVKKAEEELGITIFNRSLKPLGLTDEGKIYINSLEKIRSVEKGLKERLSDISDLKIGNITVGGENFISSFIIPEILIMFSKEYSGITVDLVESNSADLFSKLSAETVDLLLAHEFDSNLYLSTELFKEQVILAVPENLPVNKRLKSFALSVQDIKNGRHKNFPAPALSEFKDENFLLLKPGNDMAKRAAALCFEAGFSPKVKIRLDQLITSYFLACSGMGISFVSDIIVKKAGTSGCVYYTVDGESAFRTMSVGFKKSRYMSRAVSAFIKTAVNVYKTR